MSVTDRYEPVIGLEIHAELLTDSKMFCGCRVVDSVEALPNSAVCPVCLGMPGMLPVINERAIEYALRVALALNCEIQLYNIFARKSYFYPDLPKAYQISQYELPLARNGWLDVETADGTVSRIRIRRVHMEEDTGKLTHLENGGSLVDYNRSGVPLLEIVTEPDVRSGEEARIFTSNVRRILRYLGVNSGDMEKGVLRVEPNISIRPVGSETLGTRTELKNLNSFRALADGTDFEIRRQAAVLDAGEQVVQETRGWHDTRRETFSQRVKEEADDYRYFAEPDLPPLLLEEIWTAEIAAGLPELPEQKIARYQSEFDLPAYDAVVLAEDREVAGFFEACVAAGGDPKTMANWMINDLFALMNEHKLAIDSLRFGPQELVALGRLVGDGSISSSAAKTVLADMFATGKAAETIVSERGLAQISDEAALAAVITDILIAHEQEALDYQEGNEKLLGWFVGQVMRATSGQANPALAKRLLATRLAAWPD
ncbi:MAG: Asp-tRNA(Asn)/Glu-tRNA(Gln) amidotransferase subunit GatB [Candidatus Promineifilaceae bacterium]